jgi:hypothetical protein
MLMNHELEAIRKEVAVAISRYYPGICPGGTEKSHKKPVRIASVPSEIRNGYSPSRILVYSVTARQVCSDKLF